MSYRPGDILRIRNRFKGGHTEEVTVISVGREGHGLEVRDCREQIWGYIWATEVLELVSRAR